MKKALTIALVFILAVLLMSVATYAEENAQWSKDNPTIMIYDAGTVVDDFYEVNMVRSDGQEITTDHIAYGTPIRLLMINGGFVPGVQIIVENDRTLVPVRIISEILEAKVDWDKDNRSVTITDAGILITLKIDSTQCIMNGQEITLEAPARIYSDKTYVPLRFIAEALNARVDYSDNIIEGESWQSRFSVSIVTVEKMANKPVYTQEDASNFVFSASSSMYQQVANYLTETGREFSDAYPQYDFELISFVKNLGRYYVYKLEGFESFPILFNSYTGEIYSQHAGLPFLYIAKGFINISWMYQ